MQKSLYLNMQKKVSNKKKRVLATKKVSSNSAKARALKFQQVTSAELKASRNPAYSYLVK